MDACRTPTQPTQQRKPRMEWRIVGDEFVLAGAVLSMCGPWFAFAWAFVRDGLEDAYDVTMREETRVVRVFARSTDEVKP